MTYRPGRNQCVECDADALDKRMVCSEHAPLYDDARMQEDIDLGKYGKSIVEQMDHAADAMAYMIAGVMSGKALAQNMALSAAAKHGVDWGDDHDHEYPHREVDAMALEALCRLAGGNIGHAHQS